MGKNIKKITSFIIILFLFSGFNFFFNSVIGNSENSNLTFKNQSITNSVNAETEYWALLVAVGVYADNPEQNRPLMLKKLMICIMFY